LVPLHNWLPDAHSEGPTPISAVLSGLLLNIALYALIRCKALVDGSLGSGFAGNIMMGFGLLSLLTAAFSMLRQKDIKRLFAYSSIEHMGLAKSATFFSVGHAAQMHGTQEMAKIRGLIKGNPAVGWGLFLGVMALAGMPPFGIFTSEFLILTATMKEAPWLAIPLLLGLTVAFAALFFKVQPMVAGGKAQGQQALTAANIPVFLHLILVLAPGVYLPVFLADWFHLAAEILK
jgi:hydrogenase-4 component F